MSGLTRRTLLSGAAALAAPFVARAAEERPIRIGVLNDPNGVYADNGGLGSVIAARLAAEDFGGTLLGRKIEIIAGDHQNKPDLAAAIAREWIDRQGVDVIADGAASSAGLAIQQVTREKQRIFIIAGPGTTDLTGKACSPFGFHFSYDTYALAKGTATAVTKNGGDSWFFITADYAFGTSMERDARRFVAQSGGKVLGSVRHPLGATDFSSYLLAAQSSGAKIIGLCNAGADTQNAVKQAAEFGITRGGQRLAALLIFITDVLAVGLPTAQGLMLTTAFYWDRTPETRAWSQRFMAHKPKPPTMLQAGVYSGVLHYLKAVKEANTTDPRTVAARMHQMPVNDMNNTNVAIRADGRVMCTMYLMQVKSPAQSRAPFDVYQELTAMPNGSAFRPLAEGGCPLVAL
ncbi:MAG: ABC transporter substrate-binding protein [Acidobacteriia bacterium]|nr:ABC transporter substrate-binding protein [Methyloceanibacter sp.]MBX5472603.1 ABC transporter substrate-binding protein [Acetobacteraceae bacterium]MCL6492327.1 ABC transporter substrate-binding protein [Terriglobia bacterium]